MGFFSWNCRGCGHPMLCSGATEERNKWMMYVVVIEKDGSILKGEYDGYGRVMSGSAVSPSVREFDYTEPECWHQCCWELSGNPTEHTEASEDAEDQGWFFEDDVHNLYAPITPGQMERMKDDIDDD